MHYICEKIISGTDCSFSTTDQVGSVIPCFFHVHPEYELTYIVSSNGTRFVGDNMEMFDVGDLALIGSMVPHHYYNLPFDSRSENWGHARVVQFREDFAGKQLFELPEMHHVQMMLERSRFGLAFPREAVLRVTPLLDDLFAASGPRRIIVLLEILELLSNTESRCLSSISGEKMNVRPDLRINTILCYVNENLAAGKPVTLGKAAVKACMNPESFSRYFRKTTGRRFIDYVNEIKLGRACHLLAHTDRTIAEICYDAGFGNLSNFNRQFLRIRKMSPREYRAGYSTAADPGKGTPRES